MVELKFILSVKEHQLLYTTNSKLTKAEEVSRKNQWQSLAEDFKLANGDEARKKWSQLTEKYLQYLRSGDNHPFPYADAMQFMQQHIIGVNHNDESQSDLEMDETELRGILYSDEEFDSNRMKDFNSKRRKRASSTEGTEAIIVKQGPRLEGVDLSSDSCSENALTSTTNNVTFPPPALSTLSSLELIFLGYARELQKMPLALQIQTKRKISDIMDEAEMQMLQE